MILLWSWCAWSIMPIRIITVVVLSSTHLASAFFTREFTIRPPIHPPSPGHFMGGYYADPGAPLDQSNTHMVFGQRCLETKVLLNEKSAVLWLQPLKEEGDEVKVEVDHGPLLTLYFMEQPQPVIQGCSVVEVGASSFSLAALFTLNAKSVVVCNPDETRLRIIQHTQEFLNQRTGGIFQTGAWIH